MRSKQGIPESFWLGAKLKNVPESELQLEKAMNVELKKEQ